MAAWSFCGRDEQIAPHGRIAITCAAGARIRRIAIDLYGCGDSYGDFVDADWELWRQDALLAVEWLKRWTGTDIGLWGCG